MPAASGLLASSLVWAVWAVALLEPVRAANIHRVTVGQAGLHFNPQTVFASAGDVVEFLFYPTDFSVVQASATTPCVPQPHGFYSGPVAVSGPSVGNMTFAVNVTSSDPLYYYSGNTGDCQKGMIGAINPGSSFETYSLGAASATSAPLPTGGPVGGQLVGNSYAPPAGTLTQTGTAAPAGATAAPTAAAGSGGKASASGSGSGSGGAPATSTSSSGLAPAEGRGELGAVLGLVLGAAGIVGLL